MFDFLKYTPNISDDGFDLCFDEKQPQKIIGENISYAVSKDITNNLNVINKLLHVDINGDIVVRQFNLIVNSKSIKAFIVFGDGIVSGKSVNQFVLLPAMSKSFDYTGDMLPEYFVENIMPQNQVSYESDLVKIASSVNYGNAGILIDGTDKGIIIDIKSWEHRSVSTPINETVVQGPHEGFNEVLRCNTAIIRKTVNNSDLIFESMTFGGKSQTPASLAYIDGIINKALLKNIKDKLTKFTDDYIFSIFDIEKGIEDRKNITLPQIITTERPDKVCRALVEGRAVLLLSGSAHALILPSNITDIIASPEDAYLRKPYSVFIKFIRILSVFLSIFTPGFYLAVTRFHSESILTNMLISLAAEREGVPFSALFEIILMELSFELIKEASIRIPGSIGSSLGIVGGLILGQAAVSAGLVSPIIIILVSICGIASFAIPSYSLSFSFRISRFIYIFAGAYLGILGIVSAMFIQLCLMLGTKTFGVPFFVPFVPETQRNPFIKSLFMDYSKIPNPQYLKSYRKGDNNAK